MHVYFIIALRNLIQARRRTILLGVGLILVTFLLVSLLGLSRSMGEQLLQAATTLSSGHVNVAGWNKAKPSDAAPYISNVAEIRKIIRENTEGLDFVIDRYRGWAQLASETDSLQTGVAALDVTEEPQLQELLRLAPESEYRDDGREQALGNVMDLAEDDTIIIFVAHAKQLNVTVGDSLTIITQNPDGQTDTRDVRIVAVAGDISMMSAWTVFTPKQVLRDLYSLPEDTSGGVHVFLKDARRSEEVLAHLRQVFTDKGFPLTEYSPQPFWMKFETISAEDWIGEKLDLTYWKDEISFIVWILTVIDALSVFLVAILLVIIGVGITNTMWISVRERTGEIGTLRAIGMSKRRVLAMFLLESAILGFVATTIGAVLAVLVAGAVDAAAVPIPAGALRTFLMADRFHLAVTFSQAWGSVLAITVVTVTAAAWPSIRASRMQPITAIHQVN